MWLSSARELTRASFCTMKLCAWWILDDRWLLGAASGHSSMAALPGDLGLPRPLHGWDVSWHRARASRVGMRGTTTRRAAMVSWLERELRELGDEASTSREVIEALLRMETERRKDMVGQSAVGSGIVCESDNSTHARCSENFTRKMPHSVKLTAASDAKAWDEVHGAATPKRNGARGRSVEQTACDQYRSDVYGRV